MQFGPPNGARWYAQRALALAALLALGACTDPFAEGWDQGGTLHDKSMKDWSVATQTNRLATSAQFAKEMGFGAPEEVLRFTAGYLEKCISKASLSAPYDFMHANAEANKCEENMIRDLHRLKEKLDKEAEGR